MTGPYRWQEAAELAGLPGATATEKFGLVDCFTAGRAIDASMHRDTDSIAARLVALPPRQFQYRSARDVDRRRESDPCLGHHMSDFVGPRVGYGMDRGWPSAFEADRQSSYTGFRNNPPPVYAGL